MTPLLLVCLSLAPAPNTPAASWPQWRGPKNDGHSTETGLPAKWSASENVVWSAPLPGPGSSTPCVVGDRLFLTVPDGPDIVALCVGTDGKEKWRKSIGTNAGKAYRNDEGNDASASPSTDGQRVYFFSGVGRLVATDLDGKTVWEIDCQQKYGKFAIQFGVHQTPVLFQDRLYVSLLHRAAKLLVAVEAATGKEVWRHERQSDSPRGVESPDVYASPFVWSKGDDALLISHGDDYCTAHRLTDGAEVWRVAELNPKDRYNSHWRAVSSPLVTPYLIVVPSCKRGVTVAVDPATAKGTINPGSLGELWRLPKDTPDVPSPILVDGRVYLMGEGGVLHCYDAKTGGKKYEERLTNMRHRANPVYADGKLYLQGRDKACVVVKPGAEFELVAKNELPDTFTASPAVAGGRLYLRGFAKLWAVGAK